MEVINTKRSNNLSDYTDLNKCLESIFGKEVSDKIHKSEMTSPEDLKEHRIAMSFDDVITIWNAGVSNGVEGYKYKIFNTLKQIVNDLSNDGNDWTALAIVEQLYSKGITNAQTIEEFLKVESHEIRSKQCFFVK